MRINFDYESEAFQWDDDAEGSECVKRVLTHNQRYRFNVEAELKYFYGPRFNSIKSVLMKLSIASLR